MPQFDWQLIAALLAVAAAAWFLIHRGWKLVRAGKKSEPACGSCGSCSAATNAPGPTQSGTFVPLDAFVHNDEK